MILGPNEGMNGIFSVDMSNDLFLKFNDFRKSGVFIDCHILSNEERFDCHKIILTRWSKYFYRYFSTCSDSNVQLPKNPGNFFKNVLEFIYTRKITLNEENISFAYKCAEFYEIEELHKIVVEQLNSILSIKNVLKLSKQFVENEISSQDEKFSSIISKNFNSEKFKSKTNIFKCISPTMLANILSDLTEYTPSEKIKMIDLYYSIKPNIKEADKISLSNIFDWSDENSYKYFINHNCDWIPSNISRKLINLIINIRRSLIDQAEKEFNINSNSVFWIFPFTYLNSIQYAEVHNQKEFEITHFLKTLGGKTEKVGIVEYGLVNLISSHSLYCCEPKNAFEKGNHYFCSIGNSSSAPFFTFSFGTNSKFLVTRIECHTSMDHKYQGKTPTPKFLRFEGTNNDPNSEFTLIAKLDASSGVISQNVDLKKPYHYYRLLMSDMEIGGGYIMRLNDLKIFGYFFID
ncbi:hypothetical protein TRFO_15655 [Tritrichomonas foetus]|uniref:BTB domain-containing protein n=1 Tax=Tritrichomonas foetus TaxID=1144522 RepID=A0A1J4KSD3_9EUKA|nr:hypothetical protein TRFO_15655 [Tritrichomonas foetus]|eukprot:OHT14010.1 hypothetical protein TRFO_15655 [Tritrichomonas foetus]